MNKIKISRNALSEDYFKITKIPDIGGIVTDVCTIDEVYDILKEWTKDAIDNSKEFLVDLDSVYYYTPFIRETFGKLAKEFDILLLMNIIHFSVNDDEYNDYLITKIINCMSDSWNHSDMKKEIKSKFVYQIKRVSCNVIDPKMLTEDRTEIIVSVDYDISRAKEKLDALRRLSKKNTYYIIRVNVEKRKSIFDIFKRKKS